MGSISAGPGAGQLVQQRSEELSQAVKEKWSQGTFYFDQEVHNFFRNKYLILDLYIRTLSFPTQMANIALGGLSVFGSRTKELAETAKNQIGESAQSAQKAIGETSTGEFLMVCDRHRDVVVSSTQLMVSAHTNVRHLGSFSKWH